MCVGFYTLWSWFGDCSAVSGRSVVRDIYEFVEGGSVKRRRRFHSFVKTLGLSPTTLTSREKWFSLIYSYGGHLVPEDINTKSL